MNRRGVGFMEFAEELGIPRTTLAGYLKGTSHPRADSLEYLAEKLGISLAELVSGDEYPPNRGISCLEPVLLEMAALHPRAVPIAQDAVSLLQTAFQMSDDLYDIEEAEQETENQEIVYRYLLHELRGAALRSPEYGILVKQRCAQGWSTIALIAAISRNKHEVEHLAACCTKLQLSPCHLLDVVQDFLTGASDE